MDGIMQVTQIGVCSANIDTLTRYRKLKESFRRGTSLSAVCRKLDAVVLRVVIFSYNDAIFSSSVTANSFPMRLPHFKREKRTTPTKDKLCEGNTKGSHAPADRCKL